MLCIRHSARLFIVCEYPLRCSGRATSTRTLPIPVGAGYSCQVGNIGRRGTKQGVVVRRVEKCVCVCVHARVNVCAYVCFGVRAYVSMAYVCLGVRAYVSLHGVCECRCAYMRVKFVCS